MATEADKRCHTISGVASHEREELAQLQGDHHAQSQADRGPDNDPFQDRGVDVAEQAQAERERQDAAEPLLGPIIVDLLPWVPHHCLILNLDHREKQEILLMSSWCHHWNTPNYFLTKFFILLSAFVQSSKFATKKIRPEVLDKVIV